MIKIDSFVTKIIDTVMCHKHDAHLQVPCFSIPSGEKATKNEVRMGICNSRAIKAGYNNPINPLSLTRGAPKNNKPARKSRKK